jgi:hypothetical protein
MKTLGGFPNPRPLHPPPTHRSLRSASRALAPSGKARLRQRGDQPARRSVLCRLMRGVAAGGLDRRIHRAPHSPRGVDRNGCGAVDTAIEPADCASGTTNGGRATGTKHTTATATTSGRSAVRCVASRAQGPPGAGGAARGTAGARGDSAGARGAARATTTGSARSDRRTCLDGTDVDGSVRSSRRCATGQHGRAGRWQADGRKQRIGEGVSLAVV